MVALLLTFALVSVANAQTRNKKKTTQKSKSKPVVVEKTPQERLFEEMLPATAQILIIDSVVADKQTFLKAIPLTGDAGYYTSYNNFFGSKNENDKYLYINSFEDKCYFASPDTIQQKLYSAFRLGNEWSVPLPLNGIDEQYEAPDYPFMMADGITLYFAAKSNEGLGGYDIFHSILDTENKRFYKPQNIGLPFNSTANDYLYAISETDTLGWFVSDRNQPEDKVCIYTFVPTSTRRNYNTNDISHEQLLKYATIASIADTWTNENERKRALQRLEKLKERILKTSKEQSFTFIVNDQTIYHSIEDFKSPTNQQDILILLKKKEQLNEEKKKLDELRFKYHTANEQQRKALYSQIIEKEKLCQQSYSQGFGRKTLPAIKQRNTSTRKVN